MATAGVRLVKYDAACKAIAEAKRVDEVKTIHDHAKAMAAYARIAKNEKMKADADAIHRRAVERIGELMDLQAKSVGKAKGGWKSRGLSKNPQDTPPALAEAGIDKNLAHQARKAFRGDKVNGDTKPKKKKKKNGKPAGWRSVLAHDGEDSITPGTDTPTAFLARTGLAFDYAVYEGKEVNQAMVDAARAVANKWSTLAEQLESMP